MALSQLAKGILIALWIRYIFLTIIQRFTASQCRVRSILHGGTYYAPRISKVLSRIELFAASFCRPRFLEQRNHTIRASCSASLQSPVQKMKVQSLKLGLVGCAYSGVSCAQLVPEHSTNDPFILQVTSAVYTLEV